MNKDDLIKLKDTLIYESKYKKYGRYSPKGNRTRLIDDVKTIEEINKNINTQEAVEKMESLLVNFVKDLISRGEDFKRITVSIFGDVFASEFFLRKLNYHGEKTRISKNDILDDIIPLGVSFKAFKNDDKSSVVNFDDSYDIGIIKYSDFVNIMGMLDYDISIKTFDKFVLDVCSMSPIGPKIVIDFSKQKEHKH